MTPTPATPVAETGVIPEGADDLADVFEEMFGFDRRGDSLGLAVEVMRRYELEATPRTLTERRGTSEELDEAISLIGSLVERNTEKGEYWQGEDEADPKLYAADLWRMILDRLRAPSESSETERPDYPSEDDYAGLPSCACMSRCKGACFYPSMIGETQRLVQSQLPEDEHDHTAAWVYRVAMDVARGVFRS